MLPVAHTCFLLLDLSEYYDSKSVLEEKLKLSVLEGSKGFTIIWKSLEMEKRIFFYIYIYKYKHII